MIDIGQKMRFIPQWNKSEHDDEEAKRRKTVTGKIIYVNRQHKQFTVKYTCCGGAMMKETFKFSDIGNEVFVVRGGGYGR